MTFSPFGGVGPAFEGFPKTGTSGGAVTAPENALATIGTKFQTIGTQIIEVGGLLGGIAKTPEGVAMAAGLNDCKKEEKGKDQDDLASKIKKIYEEIPSYLTAVVDNLKLDFTDLFKDFKGFFKGLSKQLLSGLKGVFNKAAGGIFKAAAGSILGAIGIPGFASGGRMQPGVPAIVGERGPELLVPSRPTTVLNAAATKNGMGTKPLTVNQSVHFDLQPAPTISAMIDAKTPAIVQAATLGALKAMQRGGV